MALLIPHQSMLLIPVTGGEKSLLVLKHRDTHGFTDFLQRDYGAVFKVFSELEKKGSTEMGNILSELS